MSFLYKLREIAATVGICLFLVFGVITFINAKEVIQQVSQIWQFAKFTLICFTLTLGGLTAYVWGMGWFMSGKEREKMKKYRKLEAEKKKKAAELERQRKKLLRKHGLDTSG